MLNAELGCQIISPALLRRDFIPKATIPITKGSLPLANPKRTCHPALLVPLCRCPSSWHCKDLHRALYEHAPQRPSLPSTLTITSPSLHHARRHWTPSLDMKEKQRHVWYRPILPPVRVSRLNPPVTSRRHPYQARTLWLVPFGKWPHAAEVSSGQGTSASLQLYLYTPRRTAPPPAAACVRAHMHGGSKVA